MIDFAALRRDWLSNVRTDVLAGVVVALALIPEAVGFPSSRTSIGASGSMLDLLMQSCHVNSS